MILLQHHLLLLLAVSTTILEPCFSRSLRQKRGIMKMMMHVMWDPVRLIRYWYAYDVTKEIAKSWRKIIPTMMVLPLNPDASKTLGIAKYVHPAYGLRETDPASHGYQYSETDPSLIVNSYMKQTSASNDAIPVAYQQFIRADFQSRHRFANPSIHTSSKEIPVVQWPEKEVGNNGNQPDESTPGRYSQQIPFLVPNQNDDRMISKPLAGNRVVLPSNLRNFVSYPNFKKVKNKENEQGHQVYFRHPIHGTESELTSILSQAVQNDGREIHIVFHPVPITDSQSEQLRKQTNTSFNKTSNHLKEFHPFIQNATFSFVQQNSEFKFGNPEANCTSNCSTYPSKNDSSSVEEVSSETLSSNVGVTWVLQNSSHSDHVAEDSLNDAIKALPNRSIFSDFNIDMQQLKEALKHGTPVLVPFIKKTIHEEQNHEEAGKLRFSSPERDSSSISGQKLILFLANRTPT